MKQQPISFDVWRYYPSPKRDALARVIADNAATLLLLVGPHLAGKTTLLRRLQRIYGGTYLRSTSPFLGGGTWWWDSPEIQKEGDLFLFLQALEREKRGSKILAATECFPDRWHHTPDVRSRFSAWPTLTLDPMTAPLALSWFCLFREARGIPLPERFLHTLSFGLSRSYAAFWKVCDEIVSRWNEGETQWDARTAEYILLRAESKLKPKEADLPLERAQKRIGEV